MNVYITDNIILICDTMLKIHFLNVGHGDCCIVEFIDTERIAIIDINRTSDMDTQSAEEVVTELSVNKSLFQSYSQSAVLKSAGYNIEIQDPIEYLNDLPISSSIFRYISTHPHMDHLTGLNELFNRDISNFWVLENDIEPDLSKLSSSQKNDWEKYTCLRDSVTRKIGDTTVIRAKEGDSNDFWKQDNIKILAPNDDLLDAANTGNNANLMSYVLLIEDEGHKIVLGGDAEEKTWEYLVENYEDELEDVTILKASHHGRNSGYHQPAVKLMKPEYTIVSVGKKPNSDASNKYRQYSKNVFSTRWKGNIVFEIDNFGLSVDTQHDR